MGKAEEINIFYKEASGLKDKARVSNDNLDCYPLASDAFSKAAVLATEIALISKGETDQEVQCRALALYYQYESQNCLALYHYELWQPDLANDCTVKAQEYIREAIQTVTAAHGSISKQEQDYLDARVVDWQQADMSTSALMLSIDARRNQAAGNIIGALDAYKQLRIMHEDILAYTTQNDMAQVRQRIAAGNLYGAMTNAANATAFLAIGDYEDQVSLSALFQFIRNSLDAYETSKQAFQANPEWKQYLEGADTYIQNVRTLLTNHKSLWANFYAEFADSPSVISMMESIDADRFGRIRDGCNPEALMRSVRSGVGYGLLLSFLYLLVAAAVHTKVQACTRLHLLIVAGIVTLSVIISTRAEWRKRWWWHSAYPVALLAIMLAIIIGIATVPADIRIPDSKGAGKVTLNSQSPNGRANGSVARSGKPSVSVSMKSDGMGTLCITSSMHELEVYINGKIAGSTGRNGFAQHHLGTGMYQIRVNGAGLGEWSGQVALGQKPTQRQVLLHCMEDER